MATTDDLSARTLAPDETDVGHPWQGVLPFNAIVDLITLLTCYVHARTMGECEHLTMRLFKPPARFVSLRGLDNELRENLRAMLRALQGDPGGLPFGVLARLIDQLVPHGVRLPYCVTVNQKHYSWFVPPGGEGGSTTWTSCLLYDRTLEDRVVSHRALQPLPGPHPAHSTEAVMDGVRQLVRLLLKRGVRSLDDENVRRLDPEDRERLVNHWYDQLLQLVQRRDRPVLAHVLPDAAALFAVM